MDYTVPELQALLIRPSIAIFNMINKTEIPLNSMDIQMLGQDKVTGDMRYYIDCLISEDTVLRVYPYTNSRMVTQFPVHDPFSSNNSRKVYMHHTGVQGVNLQRAMRTLQAHLVRLGGVYNRDADGFTVKLDPTQRIDYLADDGNNLLVDHTGAVIIFDF